MSAVELLIVTENLFGMKAPQKRGVNRVRAGLQAGLLNMSEHEENVAPDCLAHVFWGVLDDSCRYFSNPFSPEVAQARFMDPESVRLPGTGLGHMAEKLACNKPLMNVSVRRQWLWNRINSSSVVSISGSYQQIPRWMATSCHIYAICDQKSSRLRSSPVFHAEE